MPPEWSGASHEATNQPESSSLKTWNVISSIKSTIVGDRRESNMLAALCEWRAQPLAFLISSTSAGTTWNKSPTMP
jgi:hypothetical protein